MNPIEVRILATIHKPNCPPISAETKESLNFKEKIKRKITLSSLTDLVNLGNRAYQKNVQVIKFIYSYQ